MKKSVKLFTILTSIVVAFTFLSNLNVNKFDNKQAKAYSNNDTEVTALLNILGYNGTDRYLGFKLKNNDYTFSYNNGNDFPVHGQPVNFQTVSNFSKNQIKYNNNLVDFGGPETNCYLVYYANKGTIAIKFTETLTNVKEGDKIFIPSGTSFPSYGILAGENDNVYVTSKDIEFEYKDGNFRKVIQTTSEETLVTSIKVINGYDGATKFLIVMLDKNDYSNIKENNGNDYNLHNCPQFFGDACNYGYSFEINGEKLALEDRAQYLNYFGNYGGLGINFNKEAKNLKENDTIVIKKGTSFPSYKYCKGEENIIYTNSEDRIFTYKDDRFHCCNDCVGEYLTNETEHWKTCLICERVFEKHNHEFTSETRQPTCTQEGLENSVYCSICGYIKEDGTAIPPLGHDFESSNYEYDEENHWRHCHRDCGEVEQSSKHTYGDDKKTCTVCGFVKDVVFITVNNGYLNGHEDGEIRRGEIATIIPNSPEEGKKFDAWYKDGNKVSDLATYSFEATNDETYEARYIDAPIEKKEEKKGCGGSLIVSSSIILTTSLFGILFTIKKKSY